jgi:alpha-1,2-mannosyltransferase
MGTADASCEANGLGGSGIELAAPDRQHEAFGPARLAVAGVLITVVTTLAVAALAAAPSERLAVDFRRVYMPASEAVLQGESPYLVARGGYVYPPQLAFVLTPLTFLSDDVAAILALVAVAALLVGTLYVLGVRDVLCYLALFAWAPTWQELDMASITAALAFFVALAWRYRDRTWPPALALAVVVPAKLFLWPLFVWTYVTQRLRVTTYAVVVGLGTTLALWAALRFQGLAGYPAMLRGLHETEAQRGYSLVGVTLSFGLGRALGEVLIVVVGAALLAGCIVYARKDEEQRSFTLAVGAALFFTPILWLHYLTLLAVPLAIARQRFSALWLLPCVLWVGSTPMNPDGYLTLLPVVVSALLLVRLLTRPGAAPAATELRHSRRPLVVSTAKAQA